MNQIVAKNEKSEYSEEPHLTINIDGSSLDKTLHSLYPDKDFLGLVPTLLDWLWNKEEREVVWTRLESEEKQIVPILMCPDDVDFWCTIINVEVEKTEDTVKWLRIGVDESDFDNNPSEFIGTTVKWFNQVKPMEFERIQYENFVSKFKTEIEKDEIKNRIRLWIDRISNQNKIPLDIKAFNFGLIESEKGHQLYLIGTKKYDLLDDDWACKEDFAPNEKYLNLETDSKKWNSDEIQSIVKSGIEQIIKTRTSPLTFVHKAEYLTTGFDNGTLLKIETKVCDDDVDKVIPTEVKNKKTSFWSKLKRVLK